MFVESTGEIKLSLADLDARGRLLEARRHGQARLDAADEEEPLRPHHQSAQGTVALSSALTSTFLIL